MIITVDGLRFGQLIRSTAGRDQNQFYLIQGMVGEKYIQAVDGLKHPNAKPKKKNVKHVQIMMLVAKEIEANFLNNEVVMIDTQIVAAIKRLRNQLEEGDRFHG